MNEHPEYQIMPAEAFPVGEETAAKEYWSKVDTTLYKGVRPWSADIARRIVAHAPKSVLEFGCNSGGNLEAIRQLDPSIILSGIDINGAGTSYARTQNLNCGLGDETTLLALPEQSYDLVFTLSVIDHVPDPWSVVRNLLRVTRRVLILHEPWLGEEGRVIMNKDRRSNKLIETTPYSYSWNYSAYLPQVAPDWRLEIEPGAIPTNIGRYYFFHTLYREFDEAG